jgi:hypothetical protein
MENSSIRLIHKAFGYQILLMQMKNFQEIAFWLRIPDLRRINTED